MKIIHCADIHADSRMGTHFSKDAADRRRNEIAESFERMVDYAGKNDVRAIIIAGDLFDTKETLHKQIKKRIGHVICQNPQIDFLYLRGNHDEDLSFLSEEKPANLKTFKKGQWTSYSYDDIKIYGQELSDSLPLSVYTGLNPEADCVNIVVMHGQVAEYKAKDGAPVISLPKLANKNIDYLALGHIHDYKIEKLDKRGVWSYSGCLEGRGFDECGKKGFVLLDIKDKKIKADFIPDCSRTVSEIQVELSGSMSYSQIMSAVEAALQSLSADDIVQVDLTGEISEDTDIEISSYEKALQGRFFYIRFKDRTEAIIDYKKYEKDLSLKGEFIRLVKADEKLTDEEKSKIIMTGIKALAGRLN